jgi:hypothetical protein
MIIGSEPYAWSIGMDDPVPLQVAAEIFFPAGGVTEQSLRTEILKGVLPSSALPERISSPSVRSMK